MIDSTGAEPQSPLPLLYKEYARLASSFEAQLSSTFKDFQMFGAIGAVLAWYPITENLPEDARIPANVVVLMGFIAIASIVAILGTRSVLRQAILLYYISQLQAHEAELRHQAHLSESTAFTFAGNMTAFNSKAYLPISRHLLALFILFVAIFPAGVLLLQGPRWFAGVYLIVVMILTGIHVSALRVFSKYQTDHLGIVSHPGPHGHGVE